jgi:4-diphosphocytidyl-2-C-methyl-D-erythritol kinase
MITLYEGAYAKVNLTLDVLGKREDGYHDIKSVMQAISLRDDIEIDIGTGAPWRILCDKENIPTDNSNLAWKAAEAFSKKFGVGGADVTVYKNIPIGAGLGGSSADISGVINGMAKLYGVTDRVALKELADTLGSDTGYMLTGGFARMQGRGDKVTPLAIKERLNFLLICPSSGVSAGGCYKQYDELPQTLQWKESATQGCIDALLKNNVNDGGRYLMNDLYVPALHLNKDVETAYHEAVSFSPLGVTMSGSGSAVLALFETKELCQWAQSRYRGKYRTYVVQTVVPDYTKMNKTFGWRNPFVLSAEEQADAED